MNKFLANAALVTLALLISTDRIDAQQPNPTPDKASSVLSMLDRNGDKKVSRDEAMGELKANFAFVDRDGDGGVSLEELTRVLKIAGGQRAVRGGDAKSTSPSFGTRNEQQWARMQSRPAAEDHEFLMVNLIKYRAKAKYADGRKTDLTGEQADALYAPLEFIAEIGGEVAFVGQVTDQMGKQEPRWDRVALVRYPSRSKFLKMVNNPQFQDRAVHKDAGIEFSQVLVTERQPSTLAGAQQMDNQRDAFTLAQLLRYRKTAKYANDNQAEGPSTGKQAMNTFDAATQDILRDVGASFILKTKVEGTLIGDGRTWDEFRLLHFPSQAAYLEATQRMREAMKHCDAAVEDSYLMKIRVMHQRLEP